MRILFTGASSFTGFVFVKELAAAGHELICPLRGVPDKYQGIRGERVEHLRSLAKILPGVSFGSAGFLNLIQQEKPTLLCHHAAEASNYRSADFDLLRALENNTRELRTVLADFRKWGGKGVLLTGTVFEQDEGAGEEPLRAFSPYGLSKGLTWQMFRYYCGAAGVPIGKFVIPNPFGPWEEPRFTSYLMNTWKEGKSAKVMTPDYVRDNIHVDLLAMVYLKFAAQLLNLQDGFIKTNPSGYAESQGAFAMRVAGEVKQRTDWKCNLELAKQEDFSEPRARTNLQPAAPEIPQWNERSAWDSFVEFYTRQRSPS